jgi:signal transduction histidine kinase
MMIFAAGWFTVTSLQNGTKMRPIQKTYIACCVVFVIWAITMLGMKFTDPANTIMLYVWDSLSYVGVTLICPLLLLIAMVITGNSDKTIPAKWLLIFVLPLINNIVVWTNPLHHLHYKVFSVLREEMVPGPHLIVSGLYSYACIVAGIILMLGYAWNNRNILSVRQSAMYVIGALVPLLVSIIATSGVIALPISATPLSFAATLICHYIAIYRLHIMDIRLPATQQVLDGISDGYLILSEDGIVIDYNNSFKRSLGQRYGIVEGRSLEDLAAANSEETGSFFYNLLTSVESCRDSLSKVSYEQTINQPDSSGEYIRRYYITDVTPLLINNSLSGFIILFKDFTEIKKNLQQLQDNQNRMLEQERLAFLGQMIGGLAHNLKTPIMGISGCASAIDRLVSECIESQGNPNVTLADYQEMHAEAVDWLHKIRESCSYMSDIISAIKGQAANAISSSEIVFTIEELFKRTHLLMRHELQSGNCQLVFENDQTASHFTILGDINNLIQVLNNFVTNAIHAMQETGGGVICLGTHLENEHLDIYVKDEGPGLEPKIRERLFKEMITSKGAGGTGLGLYISNAIIRGKFDGKIWEKDNPTGGAIFGVSIPLEKVQISNMHEERKVFDEIIKA